ncbi:uncharacterized protein LOC120335817 [Styela clava]
MIGKLQKTLCGIFIIYVTQKIFVVCQLESLHSQDQQDLNPLYLGANNREAIVQQFVKSSDRSIRSIIDCHNATSSKSEEVTYGDDVNITCPCTNSSGVIWLDDSCEEMLSSPHIYILGNLLMIRNYSKHDSASYYCSVDERLIQILITGKEHVTHQGNAAVGVVVCIILAVLIVTSLCCFRKHRTTIGLCFRDTCHANDGRDGKIYDAYVSTGVSETDRRFVEDFVREVLKRKCGYNLFVDDKNLLPQLDYNDKLQANLHKCRRLIVVFSATYMTHDWCMYCLNEGLRKIVDLGIPTIFVITDHSISSELRTHSDIIAHIPQILLAQYQTTEERQQAIEKVRQKMPPPMRRRTFSNGSSGMKSPMLSDAESIHKSDVNFNSNGTATYAETGTEYTFDSPPEGAQLEYDEPEPEPEVLDEYVTAVQTGEELDPNKVKIHQYGPRKGFYSLTMSEEEA